MRIRTWPTANRENQYQLWLGTERLFLGTVAEFFKWAEDCLQHAQLTQQQRRIIAERYAGMLHEVGH